MSRSIWKEPFSLVNRVPSCKFLQNYQSNDPYYKSLTVDTSRVTGGVTSGVAQHLDQNAVQQQKQEKSETKQQVWSRNSMILPKHIGNKVKIYNGKSWASRKIIEGMVGHKFGEFCSTRRKTIHKINKIKQVNRKK